MTTDEILEELLTREGGFRAAVRRPDGSLDFATMYGITEPVARGFLRRTTPLTVRELQQHVTPTVAATIYRQQYVDGPGFTAANIPFEPLRVQLIDFGVNSGPARAVRWLQRVIGLPPARVSGFLEYDTLAVLQRLLRREPVARLVNDALVAARCAMITRAVASGAIRREDQGGLIARACRFVLAKPWDGVRSFPA